MDSRRADGDAHVKERPGRARSRQSKQVSLAPTVWGQPQNTAKMSAYRRHHYAAMVKGKPSSSVHDTWFASFCSEEWIPPPISPRIAAFLAAVRW